MTTLRNSVSLIGRMGTEPEMKDLGNDRSMTRFSVATNEYYKDKNGETVKETQWHNVVAWGNTAKLAEKILSKGKEVAIHGKLINRSWEDQDGKKHYITEVVANEIIAFSKEVQA